MTATYDTIDDAHDALRAAEQDVAADMGEEAVEAGWSDIVHSIASFCTPEVARELIQRNL
jgi:hypothetical protein